MTTSDDPDPALDQAVALIASFEGFRSQPYRDLSGVWTIGYGSTRLPDGLPVTADTPLLTEPEARAWLSTKVAAVLAVVRNSVRDPLTANEAVALASLSYNIGTMAFEISTLARLLNRGCVLDAAAQFDVWNRVNGEESRGLADRRAAEKKLFLTPDPVPAIPQT